MMEKLEAAKNKINGIPTLQPARKVLDSVMEMGKCAEDHFMEDDNFERFFGKYARNEVADTSPSVHTNRMHGTVRRCAKQMDRQEASGELLAEADIR
ncbi:unnamed protein product [Onchocerca flexuosa]|uniref:HD_domain domain-containing protein n=1 Tax=Onchocerca flexuosa TaxID=387005 RepID=A0A183HRK9_9BILA|nr:unnamed protein product [Onchocerca flexuosa]